VAVPPHQWHAGLPCRSWARAALYAGSEVRLGMVGLVSFVGSLVIYWRALSGLPSVCVEGLWVALPSRFTHVCVGGQMFDM
jgi:hypothetical protein